MGSRIWDVVVVGSGPAGAAAAIGALSHCPDASVLLLDRSEFPRDKCCGDAVLGTAMDCLDRHGVASSTIVSGYEASRHMRITSAGGVSVSRALPQAITILPRVVFDERLVAAARERGAEWKQATVRSVRDVGSHVEVNDDLRARVVIGADGVESVVRRAVMPQAARRNVAVAIRGYDRNRTEAVPQMVLDQGGGLAYAWSFPSSAGPANVGYGHLLKPGVAANRRTLLASLHRLLPEVEVDPLTVRAHRLPLSSSRQALACGRLLLAGDAASLVNPISGEGIYYAISSGIEAGRAAVQAPSRPAPIYRTTLQGQLTRHHTHVDVMAAMIRWQPVVEAGLRAARDRQRVFDDIATLGLAAGVITPRLAVHLGLQLIRDQARRVLPRKHA